MRRQLRIEHALMHFRPLYVITLLLFSAVLVSAQANFQDLNFEEANVSGYAPNPSVPISQAMPGWSGSYGSTSVNQVWYDAISFGGSVIAVNNTTLYGISPLDGNWSAFLFAGPDR